MFKKLLGRKSFTHTIPPLYSTEKATKDPIVQEHLYCPRNGWHWYIYEGSPVDDEGYYDTNRPKVDYLMFGLVKGYETELGYISLGEMLATEAIWVDVNWTPKPLSEVRRSA